VHTIACQVNLTPTEHDRQSAAWRSPAGDPLGAEVGGWAARHDRSMRFASSRVPTIACAALATLTLLAGCTSGSHRRAAPVPATQHRPNIVFVLTDDLSADLVRYMPHVLGMEQLGTTFPNYFVVDSLCCPSRSAIFTGQYPHNNGVFRNTGSDGGYAAYDRFGNQPKSFAVALQKSGYRTAIMGKYLNGYRVNDPPASGWTQWDVADYGYPEFNYTLSEDGIQHHYGHASSDYLTDVLSNKATSFIDTAATDGVPFALEIATFAPHRPATPAPQDAGSFSGLPAPRDPSFNAVPTNPPRWMAGFAKLSAAQLRRIDAEYARRVESVQAVDRMIGHLEDVLRVERQRSNTYFVFSSDNGYHMGQHGLLPGKMTAFDTDIRVPLVVTGPDVPSGARQQAITSSIDLAPTFLQIARGHPTDAPDGTGLLSLWHGAPAPPDWPSAALIEHHGAGLVPSDPDRQPRRAGSVPSYEAMRTPHELYVEYAGGSREYYDLRTDPLELHNVVHSLPAARLAVLHRELSALVACHGAAACDAAARV
jgi:N-acetylglucosamine-6-sulfatase